MFCFIQKCTFCDCKRQQFSIFGFGNYIQYGLVFNTEISKKLLRLHSCEKKTVCYKVTTKNMFTFIGVTLNRFTPQIKLLNPR